MEQEHDISIPLNPSDLRFLKFTVSTITFFNGTAPLSYLSERTKLIVRANPWLAGYLKRKKEGICLCYSATHNENEKTLFLTATDTLLHESMSFDELSRRLRGSLVKAGRSCLRDEPLFLVSAIAISSSKFALVCSISHSIADGHTFYRLQAMLSQALSPDSGVRAMTATRLPNFEQRLDAFMAGGNDTAAYLRSAGVVLKTLFAQLRAPRSRPAAGFWRVDSSWIDAEKKKLAARAAVSSNDVLTSWFFSTCCGSDLGLMSYNFRNRIADLTDLHAGNYVSPVGYQPADVVCPLLVRASLASARRQGPGGGGGGGAPFPGFFATVLKAAPLRLSLLTNWAGIFREVRLDGCEPVVHLPLLQGWSALTDLGIIFRPHRDALGLFVQSSEQALLAQPALAGRLCPSPSGQVDSASPTKRSGFLFLVLACCCFCGGLSCYMYCYHHHCHSGATCPNLT